jgi:hypothetical protein
LFPDHLNHPIKSEPMKQIYRLYGIPLRIENSAFLIALLISLLLSASGLAQVNSYARVTAINTGKTQLTIDNRDETYHTFTVGEEVIVIQMQDNVIGANTANNSGFGSLSAINNAGFYEVAVISAINAGRTRITLTEALNQNFTFGNNSRVQVVSFTKAGTTNYTTTANISAVSWDGSLGTGGVVAFQVAGTLTLRHSITANGQGFAGGVISDDYEDECTPNVYRTNATDHAGKGEGIYLSSSNTYSRGRGRILNGGGGGNDDNGGGGGGGNFTAGGEGGAGWGCSASPSGGLGGIALNTYLMTGTRLFMGGGGGGGQGNNGNQTAGSPGGGIIIIKANTLATGCTSSTVRITANGNSASGTTGGGNDGAGGAGAGGTILLQVNTFNVPPGCPLQIQANGGNGGDVNNDGAHGGGGGGGQGAVLFANAMPTTNITTVTRPGNGGLNSSDDDATRAGGGTGSNNAGIISGIGTVLPVQLISFSGERVNKKVALTFTATGDAGTLFTIQHATDGVHFNTIGTVKGKGNTTVNAYSFTDPRPAAGKNFYQLKLTDDHTGSTSYSGIVSVNIPEVESLPVAYPNPAHDHFTIRVDNDYSNKTHQVTITDLTGKVMYTNTYKPVNGSITVTPAAQLKPGLYIFKLTSEGYEQAGKLMIK